MRRIVILTTISRDWRHGPVNLWCPTCRGIAAAVEGRRAPWCGWCQRWLCSGRCARRHTCPARAAIFAALGRLVEA